MWENDGGVTGGAAALSTCSTSTAPSDCDTGLLPFSVEASMLSTTKVGRSMTCDRNRRTKKRRWDRHPSPNRGSSPFLNPNKICQVHDDRQSQIPCPSPMSLAACHPNISISTKPPKHASISPQSPSCRPLPRMHEETSEVHFPANAPPVSPKSAAQAPRPSPQKPRSSDFRWPVWGNSWFRPASAWPNHIAGAYDPWCHQRLWGSEEHEPRLVLASWRW
jgi:hypothetical protein